ncbi:PAS domain-containing sensor histidine kinase [Chitinophaga pinensis]|uniref:histidine kinase n=1 Tax=Chitinophaga pinensis (strain ATCC 43595 / DSM 2588 / LMG 13176 / NBRC 15968 / NCIMB 11800 / UQM 2034) TaxID=485918 RepID=A0A979GYC6_CHIPD|nr:PAS domain S-box protein [Chitinophaga pinensis]ACU61865.1 PAS/PAC sensor signal transduction histidine kinase [Chitinophaga pinensis DSM 2588]
MENTQPFTANFISNGSEVGKLIHAYDWSSTPLGTMASWPKTLQFSLNMLLHTNLPMMLFWGDRSLCFYNDAFLPLLPAGKQTLVPGKAAAELWPDTWPAIQPAVNQVRSNGDPVSHDNDIFARYSHNGHSCHHHHHYSPIQDETGLRVAVLLICTQTAQNKHEKSAVSAQHFKGIVEQAPNPIFIFKGEDMVLAMANEPLLRIWGVNSDAIGKPMLDTLPELKGQGFMEMLLDVYHNKHIVTGKEKPAVFHRPDGRKETMYFNFVYQPYKEADGTVSGVLVIANDVTEQVVARKRLEESELRFRALVMATSDVVYRMNPDWSEMQNLVGRGFLTDTEVPTPDWLKKYIHPDDQPHVQALIKKSVQTHSVFELEHQVFRQDGAIGWTFSRAIPIHDEAGNIIEWFGAASDITQRKRFEQELESTRDELRVSKRLYEAVTASTPDLIYIFDRNYKFIYANQALLTMWGRTWEESVGQGLLALGYEPWHAEMHEREIDQVIATKKPIRGEVAFPHSVMGYRMYDYIFAPVLNEAGEVEVVAGTTRDISDLKVAELALKHSEEQFRTLTQSLPQLICTADIHGYCDFFNQQWYDYTGSHAEDAEGKGWMMYVHPNQRELLYDKWERSLKSGESLAFEFQLKARDGHYQWFYIVGNPIKDEDGEILKWVSALTNIEEQKAVEEKLEQLVNERTGALQRSNDDLEQFAHVASHDLKEPVRKIKTFVDRLEHDGETKLSEKGSSYLNKINTAANRMYDMIEGVLNYSSIDNAEQPLSSINLNETLNSIELDLEILMNQKKAHIVYEGLPTVKGAPLLIYQLFYNLINNSLKFTRLDTPPLITVTAKKAAKMGIPYLQIDVKDNGIGFEQTQAQKIFNSFIRLNSKDKFEGTGLGLALCKKIVERHQGYITASGAENEGAVFSIFLPDIN